MDGIVIGLFAVLAWGLILAWSLAQPTRRFWPPNKGSLKTAIWAWGLTILIYLGTIRAAGTAPLDLPGWMQWGLGGLLSLFGSTLHSWGTWHLGLKATSGWNAGLVTGGPYALRRHPQYLGQCLMLLGLALLLDDGASLSLALAGAATLAFAAYVEDRHLAVRHPAPHQSYRRRTRFLF